MSEFGKVYGGALYALAQEEHLEDVLLEEMDTICASLKENPDYLRLIDSRSISKAERLSMLDVAFIGRINAYLLNFMKILCERNGFSQIHACREAYVRCYNEDKGIVPAKAVSATEMSDEQRRRLVEALEKKTGKRVQLTLDVDPQLRGGLRVEMEGYRYDNTVASRMDQLRRALQAQS